MSHNREINKKRFVRYQRHKKKLLQQVFYSVKNGAI